MIYTDREREYVNFADVVAIKETELALLCDIDGEEVWIPKSQISEDSDVCGEGDEGTLTITEWIAREKDLA